MKAYTLQVFQDKLTVRNEKKPPVYLKGGFINTTTKCTFACKYNHEWEATPQKILSGTGCPRCSRVSQSAAMSHDNDWFILQLNQRNILHIPQEPYKGGARKISFRCVVGHIWKSSPNNILRGSGCPHCYGNAKHTQDTFTSALLEKNILHTPLESYKNNRHKLEFQCPFGHRWKASPSDVLMGYGCPLCARKPYSSMAVRWLNDISARDGIIIQHAENGGEYILPGSHYRVDGWHGPSNTVFEFHGDRFHGNPRLFSSDDRCHPFDSNITAGELYSRTCIKEKFIRDQGYNLITMWEMDFKQKPSL